MSGERRVFRLVFPADLRANQVTAWLAAVAGLGRGWRFGVLKTRSVTFELLANSAGIEYWLQLPASESELAVRQLRTLMPGIRVMPARTLTRPVWQAVAEVAMTRPQRRLRTANVETMVASLLAAVQTLAVGEAVLLQLVLCPAAPENPPAESDKPVLTLHPALNYLERLGRPNREELADRQAKLAEPNFLAVLRLAAGADQPVQAAQLVRRVGQTLDGFGNANTQLRRRWLPAGVVRQRVVDAKTPLIFPMELSASEVLALLGWPVGQPYIAGLPPAQTKHMPATEAVPRTGRVLATSNFPGAERPLAISAEDSLKHLQVIGPTGVGKTTLLANLLAQDMAAGHGVVLIESKGDLFRQALQLVPKDRMDEVIVLDVTDTGRPVGFNILRDGQSRAAIERICALFERLYGDQRGVWVREVLYHGLRTLTVRPDSAFVDLAPLLQPMSADEEAWRSGLLAEVHEPEIQHFWQRFDKKPGQYAAVQPVLDRIWQLNARPEIRNIIGQGTSSFDMAEVLRTGKILLVNLAGVGQATASLVGTLLINSIWAHVQAGGLRRPVFLHLDEFQDFLRLPIEPGDMLARARSLNLGLILAHQLLAPLPHDLRAAVMANARSKVVFQLSADDALSFSREFGRWVSQDDLMQLGQYEVICRLATGAAVGQPVTGKTLPPAATTSRAGDVRVRSARMYGRPSAQVEADIAARRRPHGGGSRPKPKIGGQEWN
ncbi:type IV secretory system conjugative DNA transfer family protein [Fodinicola acaciae]|uniref:type IV secretory system conjugative DNA transfer family protein n=1 Tax=Fodinicola acaciae TaxID=2681555 RepID=UPI0013D37685|nr:type IV secretion system DNA-binding domain-containing protein [Fodinicola acaciae]